MFGMLEVAGGVFEVGRGVVCAGTQLTSRAAGGSASLRATAAPGLFGRFAMGAAGSMQKHAQDTEALVSTQGAIMVHGARSSIGKKYVAPLTMLRDLRSLVMISQCK